ncbi:MAG: hypothetical protein ACOYOA_10915 [Saprospiraceae bacterium]
MMITNLIAKGAFKRTDILFIIFTLIIMSCNLENNVLISQKSYQLFYNNGLTASKKIEVIKITRDHNGDTLVQSKNNFFDLERNLVYFRTDSLGILCKEGRAEKYKRYLYFQLSRKNIYCHAGIPRRDKYDDEIFMIYDSVHVITKMLRSYDTLILNRPERRFVFQILELENEWGGEAEINNKFELIYKRSFQGTYWKELVPMPDSLTTGRWKF